MTSRWTVIEGYADLQRGTLPMYELVQKRVEQRTEVD